MLDLPPYQIYDKLYIYLHACVENTLFLDQVS